MLQNGIERLKPHKIINWNWRINWRRRRSWHPRRLHHILWGQWSQHIGSSAWVYGVRVYENESTYSNIRRKIFETLALYSNPPIPNLICTNQTQTTLTLPKITYSTVAYNYPNLRPVFESKWREIKEIMYKIFQNGKMKLKAYKIQLVLKVLGWISRRNSCFIIDLCCSFGKFSMK